MNVQLKDITVTARDGRVSHLDQVYIRGSHVRFFIVPDMLRCVVAWIPGERRERLTDAETRPCSAREASAVAVLGWRVGRRPCRGRGGREGVSWEFDIEIVVINTLVCVERDV
jgi:hypothetical protein